MWMPFRLTPFIWGYLATDIQKYMQTNIHTYMQTYIHTCHGRWMPFGLTLSVFGYLAVIFAGVMLVETLDAVMTLRLPYMSVRSVACLWICTSLSLSAFHIWVYVILSVCEYAHRSDSLTSTINVFTSSYPCENVYIIMLSFDCRVQHSLISLIWEFASSCPCENV